ncbi:MAG TPA: class I SAM-dependent methyltransferase [Clostridia bacterium]|nr:class I SAM-dependent methyltransferase [Clostridia bacterium]
MNEFLREESEKLTRSWMQHEASWLRDYLVAGVEDPRINLQSILSRHFLTRAVAGSRFNSLLEQEYRFAATLGWLQKVVGQPENAEERDAIRHALQHGADNAEGIEIPHLVLRAFASLPVAADGVIIPNYLESFLSEPDAATDANTWRNTIFNTFCGLWREALEREFPSTGLEQRHSNLGQGSHNQTVQSELMPPPISVVEPACGSANDYRFVNACGLARLLNYTGFDLCATNIENARALFPGVRFETGNVFEIAAADKSFDYCIVHDLFEHLSLEGMQIAVNEVCRVTRHGLCIGFFQMDETPEHLARPVDDYHWNLLSVDRMKEAFASRGFHARVIHIGTFLRQHVGCSQTHNPNAYTFLLHAG